MKKRGQYGHVINISSMSAHRVPPGGHSFYAATKHALRALTEGLRQEARHGTRVFVMSVNVTGRDSLLVEAVAHNESEFW